MTYDIRSQKWGDPTRGTESGEIEWSMNFSTDLKMVAGTSLVDYENAMRAAFNRWEEVADIDFQLVGNSGGEITAGMEQLSGSTVGLATWNSGPVISFGIVDMDSDVTWSPYGGSGGESFYAVALHEIGHILGFDHVDDVTEIMNAYVSTNNLGDGDIAGAQALYGDRTTAADPDDPSTIAISDRTTGTSFSSSDGGDGGGGGGAILGILGLLGLLFGAIFGGAGVIVAAATAGPDESDEPDEDEEIVTGKACGHDGPCDCGHDHSDDPLVFTHAVYATEADYLASGGHDHSHDGHDHSHGGCDHEGPCDCHMHEQSPASDNTVLLTDLIPITGMLTDEPGDVVEDTEDVEDLLDYV